MNLHRCSRLALSLLFAAAPLAAQAAWTHLYPTAGPPRRTFSAMAFDSVGSRALLFGGVTDTPVFGVMYGDLWSWDGSQWQQLTVPGPPARYGHTLVFDSARARAVMFGGMDVTNNYFSETWEFGGGQWSLRLPVHHPTARANHAMAFDSRRGLTVLFGGASPFFPPPYGDTWEWDGNDWNQRTPSVSPIPRSLAQLAYDAVRGVSVLFGGAGNSGNWYPPLSDTWVWDGVTWTQRFPANNPPPSSLPRMTQDDARGRIVLCDNSGSLPWEWDGQNWHAMFVSPPPFTGGTMAYDAARRQVVYYGDAFQAGTNFGDTWVYATASPATFTAYGNGCAGSAGEPVLANAPYSLPWLGDTFRTRVTSLASATSTVVFATSVASTLPVNLAPYGMPGCYGLVDYNVIALDFVATAANAAEWSIAVPNSTALNGAHVFQQAIALEAGANAAGAIVSNAGDIGVGIR